MIQPTCLLVLALLTTPAASQDVSICLRAPSGLAEIRTFHPGNVQFQSPAGLKRILLLPIDFVGRTEIERLLPQRPRRIADIPGASRLMLPAGKGSLYRYSRDDGASGHAFGFFCIDSSGVAQRVFELSGTGPALDQDPFVARIAVAPVGGSILVATTAAAGGDLLEVWLTTGTVVNRTDNVDPLNFSDAGLALHDRWGVAVSTVGVWRFDRRSRILAQAVPFTPAPSFFSGELVLSSNGRYAATTAGDARGSLHVWIFGETGPATCGTTQPRPIAGAGFLPESPDGPYLAVSNDGVLFAWCEQLGTDEAFLAAVGQTPLHVTSDGNYVDTLDGVGQFIFDGARLAIAVGERSLGVLENIDLYTAELVGGVATLVNVSLSSGNFTTPFGPSTIQPEGAVWLPQTQTILLADSDANQLISIRPGQSGVNILLQDVRGLDMVEPVGTELVLSIRRDSGEKPRQIAVLPADLGSSPNVVFSSDSADRLERPAAHGGGWFAFVEKNAALERLHLLEVGTGIVQAVIAQPALHGPAETFTSNGVLVFSIQGPAPATSFLARPISGSVQTLFSSRLLGQVLPGP